MYDEPVAAVAGLPALQYTLNHYLLYPGQVQECVTALSRGEGTVVGGLGGYPGLLSGWSVQSYPGRQGGQCPEPQTSPVPL